MKAKSQKKKPSSAKRARYGKAAETRGAGATLGKPAEKKPRKRTTGSSGDEGPPAST